MRPSDFGLTVYRHHFFDEDQQRWEAGGFSLQIPEDVHPTQERYEPTEAVPDETGGVAVYLFSSQTEKTAFLAGLYASGDELQGCAGGMTNLGCLGVVREFSSHESFIACTRTNDRAHVLVIDLRHIDVEAGEAVHLERIQDEPVIVQHRAASIYGGRVIASPEYAFHIGDERSERGEACMSLHPAMDDTGESMLTLCAGLDTIPGGARTVPHIRFHHGMDQRRFFRLYKHSIEEYLLFPEPGVKFAPHLMPNGMMGFKVSEEQ